jgi:protein gp37
MAKTKIEWATDTWSPVTGCTPISEGCERCYAKRMANRLRGRFGYPADDPFRVTFHPDRLNEPLKWKKPRRIFVCSMSDLFHENVPTNLIHKVLSACHYCQRHTLIFLTKRPKRVVDEFSGTSGGGYWLPNMWIGVTVENNKNRWRIEHLIDIPAKVRFVSVEPMLEHIDLEQYLDNPKPGGAWPNYECRIGWVIAGPETGPGARRFDPDWARDLRDQCRAVGIPFFMKRAKEMPADLQIEEYPEGV